MSSIKDYHIKPANYREIQLMLKWASSEKWNPGLNDALAFQMIDPRGFFIGYLNNEPISCISALKYSDDYAFIGLYIVKPECRGQGFGKQIWQHALQYTHNYSLGLDGVVEQQKNYSKYGFQLAYRNIRYSLNYTKIFQHFKNKYVKSVDQIPLSVIFDYDKINFFHNRCAFLTYWVFMPNAKSLAYFIDEKIKGYGVIRKCQDGYKIGPLFADSYEIANNLFQGLCQTVKNDNALIFLDIPESNLEAQKIPAIFSMNTVFEVARMYVGNVPNIPIHHIFGVTTFEAG